MGIKNLKITIEIAEISDDEVKNNTVADIIDFFKSAERDDYEKLKNICPDCADFENCLHRTSTGTDVCELFKIKK